MPKDSEYQCRKNIKYQNNVIILHNCDTHSLTSSSRDFHKYLFEWENNPWKGRPLYILTGTIVSPIIFPFSEINKTISEKNIQTNFNKKKFLKKFPVYLSFILLQYFFLYLCLKIVFFLMNKGLTSLDKLLITGTILSTPLISSMFWHVHPSFLIITLPFFSLL